MIEAQQQVSFLMCDITNKMFIANVLMHCDKANNFWFQPERVEKEKETKLDYDAIQSYFESSEWLIDLEDKYGL